MKKLLVLLALTALVFALLAACDSKDTAPPAETTTAVAEVQATVEDTQAPEVQTTLKTEEAYDILKGLNPDIIVEYMSALGWDILDDNFWRSNKEAYKDTRIFKGNE